jgi:uncharacterized protein (DUF1330 family)
MAAKRQPHTNDCFEVHQPTAQRRKTMTAFIVVDLTPADAEKAQAYGAAAATTVTNYDGEFVVKGEIEALNGGDHHQTKAIIKFPDREAALNWYQSDEYQTLIPLRDQGFDSIFHLVA